MTAHKLKTITRMLTKLDLQPETREEFKSEVSKILLEWQEHERTIVQRLEKELAQNSDKYNLLLPGSLQKLTLGQVIAAGGSFYVDEDQVLLLRVPQDIMATETNDLSTVVQSRYILGDGSSTINKTQSSMLKSKKSRKVAPAPNHSMTTRKKQEPLSRNSDSDNSSFINRPPSSSRGKISTSTLKKKTSSTVIEKATNAMPVTKTKSQTEKASVITAPTPINQPPPMKTEADGPISITSDTEASIPLTPIDPKTPNGENRLFKKPPRLARPDEVIVHCSKAGTPLIVNSERLQPNNQSAMGSSEVGLNMRSIHAES